MDDPISICVIDDEKIVCERLQPILEKGGYSVEAFTDSAAALKRLSEKNFDIVISDIKMGYPDGMDLLQYIMDHSPDTRVIIITGFATVETARKAMKGGAVEFITKPFRLSQMKELINKLSEEISGSKK